MIKNDNHKRSNNGFTLMELMIVIAIIGIIAAIALPSYQNYVIRTHRTDASAALLGFSQAMERYFMENNSYLGAAAGGADTGAPAIFPSQSPIDSGDKSYDLTIQAATGTTYTLRATPRVGSIVATNGFLQIQQNGVREWDRDNSGGITAGENTWDN